MPQCKQGRRRHTPLAGTGAGGEFLRDPGHLAAIVPLSTKMLQRAGLGGIAHDRIVRHHCPDRQAR
jgi:hypothetical protein